jgi:hypothetical protein
MPTSWCVNQIIGLLLSRNSLRCRNKPIGLLYFKRASCC